MNTKPHFSIKCYLLLALLTAFLPPAANILLNSVKWRRGFLPVPISSTAMSRNSSSSSLINCASQAMILDWPIAVCFKDGECYMVNQTTSDTTPSYQVECLMREDKCK